MKNNKPFPLAYFFYLIALVITGWWMLSNPAPSFVLYLLWASPILALIGIGFSVKEIKTIGKVPLYGGIALLLLLLSYIAIVYSLGG